VQVTKACFGVKSLRVIEPNVDAAMGVMRWLQKPEAFCLAASAAQTLSLFEVSRQKAISSRGRSDADRDVDDAQHLAGRRGRETVERLVVELGAEGAAIGSDRLFEPLENECAHLFFLKRLDRENQKPIEEPERDPLGARDHRVKLQPQPSFNRSSAIFEWRSSMAEESNHPTAYSTSPMSLERRAFGEKGPSGSGD
jgi:hypothetical protein